MNFALLAQLVTDAAALNSLYQAFLTSPQYLAVQADISALTGTPAPTPAPATGPSTAPAPAPTPATPPTTIGSVIAAGGQAIEAGVQRALSSIVTHEA